MQMNTKTFCEAVAGMKVLPDDARRKFLVLADKLPPAELDKILLYLRELEVDHTKNETKHANAVTRGRLMLQQIKGHDLPAFDALFHA